MMPICYSYSKYDMRYFMVYNDTIRKFNTYIFRYDTLRCRIAGADAAVANVVLITVTSLALLLWKH